MFRWSTWRSWGADNRAVVLLLAGAALVRVLGLTDVLWYDEAFTSLVARLPIPNLMGAVVGDVHPPLWYVIEWVIWHLGGQGDVWLRLPSYALGLVNLVVLYRLARRILGDRVAVVALAVGAGSPFLVYYSQEARGYNLLLAGLLLALAGGLAGRWIWFVVGSLVALYTHNLAAPSLAVVVLAVAVWRGQRILWPLYFAAMIVGVLWIPGLVLALYQMGHMARGFWIFPLTPGEFLIGLMVAVVYSLPSELFTHGYILALVILVAVVLVAVRGIGHAKGRTRRGLVVGLLLLIGPPVALAIPSILWRSVYLHRALILSVVGLAILGGYTWQALGRNARRVTLALVVPFVALALGGAYGPGVGRDYSDYRAWSQMIKDQWRPGDAVYHLSLASYISMAPYLEGVPSYVLPQAGDLAQSLSDPTKDAMMIPQVPACQAAWLRLWLVDFRTPYTSQAEAKAGDELRNSYKVLQAIPVVPDQHMVDAGIYLLERPGGNYGGTSQIPTPGQPVKRT